MAKKKVKKAKKVKWLRRLVRRKIKKSKPVKKKTFRNVGKKKALKKVKKSFRKAGKEEKFEVGFEEVTVKCPSCGREFRVVKSSGFSMEGMLCQRCAAGGGVGLEGDDDF